MNLTFINTTKNEKLAIYTELGILYRGLKMERKCNYYFFKAAALIIKDKPNIGVMLMNEVKKSE